MQDLTSCHRTGDTGGAKKPKPYKVAKINGVTGTDDIADVELISPMTDPQGMYTGIPANPTDEPVQDADDL